MGSCPTGDSRARFRATRERYMAAMGPLENTSPTQQRPKSGGAQSRLSDQGPGAQVSGISREELGHSLPFGRKPKSHPAKTKVRRCPVAAVRPGIRGPGFGRLEGGTWPQSPLWKKKKKKKKTQVPSSKNPSPE